MFEPTMLYDDIKLCNAVGLNKNSSGTNEGLFSQENNYLQNLQAQKTNEKVSVLNEFMLYPNPATSEVKVKYQLNANEVGTFMIFDLLGRKLKEVNLTPNSNYAIISTQNLQTGIYTFKYLKNNIQSQTVKLTIE